MIGEELINMINWRNKDDKENKKEEIQANSNEGKNLKVAAKSSPKSVAGALAGVIREEGKAEMRAIGAGAVNQAIKAMAIARGFVAPSGLDLICIPAFIDIEIDGEERTAIKIIVEPR
jgi:stage V sporulation protein S